MPNLTLTIPGRCDCGNAGPEALTLHTDAEQGEWREVRGGRVLVLWRANDGDLVVCRKCGKRYVCRDSGDGCVEVVEEVAV